MATISGNTSPSKISALKLYGSIGFGFGATAGLLISGLNGESSRDTKIISSVCASVVGSLFVLVLLNQAQKTALQSISLRQKTAQVQLNKPPEPKPNQQINDDLEVSPETQSRKKSCAELYDCDFSKKGAMEMIVFVFAVAVASASFATIGSYFRS